MTPADFFEQAKATLDLAPTTPLQSAYQFGVDADDLANLVLTGIKTATTSAYDLYESDEPLPQVGAYDVILNAKDDPICVTKTDTVTIKPYTAVDAAHAFHEGEGDRSYSYWRQVHDTFFTQEYASVGQNFDPATAKMVLEQFHVVYPISKK
ncbi:ASCH domain-containing protein [Lactiplantibacillus sp. WILCCON 0030]|uniref:ASCH domain-containing protein n=1 Tax=Lactiplantibacillus brownii TaxID=3069269 RepID=A0ABU1A5U3_9LACO|nr:ASCH domain-containing protein [Lactiplantibacillus brownii]MDQ7936075.1 ASCH domain-containing protein [Lactiplantibacillus brownii]